MVLVVCQLRLKRKAGLIASWARLITFNCSVIYKILLCLSLQSVIFIISKHYKVFLSCCSFLLNQHSIFFPCLSIQTCSLPFCFVCQELDDSKDDKDAEKLAMLAQTQKPLHKVISEHKDIIKVVIPLNSIISSFKVDCQEVLDSFTQFSELWNAVSIECYCMTCYCPGL